MNLIDNSKEYIKLKEVADEIFLLKGEQKGPKLTSFPIMEFGFDTPIELQKQLKELWNKMGKKDMEKFIPVVTVSTFKNRNVMIKEKVSPFNYEF